MKVFAKSDIFAFAKLQGRGKDKEQETAEEGIDPRPLNCFRLEMFLSAEPLHGACTFSPS